MEIARNFTLSQKENYKKLAIKYSMSQNLRIKLLTKSFKNKERVKLSPNKSLIIKTKKQILIRINTIMNERNFYTKDFLN